MTPDHSADFKAVLIVLLSYLMFSCADALVKYNAQFLGTFEIMFWDSFFTALVMLGYVIFCKGFEAVKTEKLKYHIIKGGFNSFFIWLVIFGLAHTTFAEFYLLIFTAPMWVVLFSMLINKERFDLRRFFYVLLGFGVIAWTVFPEGGLSFHIGTAAVLFLAAGFGFTIIYGYFGLLRSCIPGAGLPYCFTCGHPCAGWVCSDDLWGGDRVFGLFRSAVFPYYNRINSTGVHRSVPVLVRLQQE